MQTFGGSLSSLATGAHLQGRRGCARRRGHEVTRARKRAGDEASGALDEAAGPFDCVQVTVGCVVCFTAGRGARLGSKTDQLGCIYSVKYSI